MPEESPDKKWHLFAHSIFGIQHYLSENGVDWKKNKTVVRAAMRPFIYKENNMYFLFYEKYHAMKLLFSFLPNQRWYSQIEVVSSKDLIQWTTSKVLIKPMLNFHQDIKLGKAVGNPCLTKTGKTYRLYFSSSLVNIPDCGFNDLYISVLQKAKQ